MLHSHGSCSVLLLLMTLNFVDGVCTLCFGQLPGCNNTNRANCPGVVDVAANVAAVTAAAGAVVSISKILPHKYIRVFPASAIKAIVALVARPKDGASFDFTDKSGADIVKAVRAGQTTKDEAIERISDMIEAVDPDGAHPDIEIKKLDGNIKSIEAMSSQVASTTSSAEGAFLYVLYRLTLSICGKKKGTAQFEYADIDADPVAGSSSSPKAFMSTLVRPVSEAEVASLFNSYILTGFGFGLFDPLVIVPFLEEAYHSKVRTGVASWAVGFELVLIYIQRVEANPTRLHFGNVIDALGASDTLLGEATNMALLHYPLDDVRSAFFRTRGGTPRDNDKKSDKVYTGDIKGFTSASKLGCFAHTHGTPHLAKHVLVQTTYRSPMLCFHFSR